MMFFDDRLAMPGIYGGSVAEAVRLGARPVKLDLSIVLGVDRGATRSIGLGATYSTTYYSPFHVARTFATLDHLSGGRAAWNVVTSVNDSEAQNFGLDEHLGHDERYDRADEFLEATTGLWDTWEDDALVLDREAGIFADPDKVHELELRGRVVQGRAARSPCPARPQGRPVLLQAGSSGRGRDFAARWAELIFTGDPGIEVARSALRGAEGADRRGRPRSRRGEDAADGLHGRRRVQGPGPGARAVLPQRPGRPDGVAHAAVRAHELRLLRASRSTRRSPTSSSSRCRASAAWSRTCASTSAATRDPRRPGRPPRHPAAGPPLRGHRRRGRRPDGGVVRPPTRATGS